MKDMEAAAAAASTALEDAEKEAKFDAEAIAKSEIGAIPIPKTPRRYRIDPNDRPFCHRITPLPSPKDDYQSEGLMFTMSMPTDAIDLLSDEHFNELSRMRKYSKDK